MDLWIVEWFDENETRNQIKNTFDVIISWISMNAMHFLGGSRASVTYSPFVIPCIAIRIMWIDVSLKHYYKNTIFKSPIKMDKNTLRKIPNNFSPFFGVSISENVETQSKCTNAFIDLSISMHVPWYLIWMKVMIHFAMGFIIQLFIIMFFAHFRTLRDVHLYRRLFAFKFSIHHGIDIINVRLFNWNLQFRFYRDFIWLFSLSLCGD